MSGKRKTHAIHALLPDRITEVHDTVAETPVTQKKRESVSSNNDHLSAVTKATGGSTGLCGVNVTHLPHEEVVHSAACCLSGSNPAHPLLNSIAMERLRELVQGFGLHRHQCGDDA